MNLQLSIIVPVYNVEKYLHRCMESLLAQDISDYEIILVDDGSKDQSPGICDKYAQDYSFVNVIHKKNEGLGFARNSGLAMAKGKYVSFIDSDDAVSADHFEVLLETAAKQNADVCLGGMTDVYETYKVKSPHPFAGQVFNRQEIMRKLLPSMLGYDHCGRNYSGMSVCSGIYKREIIDRYGISFCSEREYISEDAIFDIAFMSQCNVAAVADSVGYNYYHNAGTLTTRYKPERFGQIKKLYLYELQIVSKQENYKELRNRIQNMFLANIRVTIMQEVDHEGTNLKMAQNSVKNIILDEEVQQAINEYDYSKMPAKQKLFCQAIHKKSVFFVCLMAWVQNKKKMKMLFQ